MTGAKRAASVDGRRLARDIEAIACFSEEDPSIGYSRPTFSPSWRKARDYVIHEAETAGCVARVDAAGNVHARPAGLGWEAPAWLCGSHVDSVPTGGKYDGVVGVAVALEVLRAAPQAPVELVVFAEEEGTTFTLGMLGSKAWAGTLGVEQLRSLQNAAGEDYLSAGSGHGVAPDRLEAERFSAAGYRGLVEAHVEQGLSLWNAGEPLAVVTGINGRRQYQCSMTGAANHAGSTTMTDRRDALAGAAQSVLLLEAMGRELDGEVNHTVITVGRLETHPNASNVIPGSVRFSVDFRSPSDKVIQRGEAMMRARLQQAASERGLGLEITRMEDLPAVPLDPGVCRMLHAAAARLDLRLPEASSGALHDTAILAPFLPSAMLFIASRDGISHNPAEFSRIEHIALAARVLVEAFSE
ncbi:MAG TPA: M20 family metallo-hydrolase [Spirochaetia bacterium]|nr:M20 family metallo-hydrolase [Spirochaetia bacterium]